MPPEHRAQSIRLPSAAKTSLLTLALLAGALLSGCMRPTGGRESHRSGANAVGDDGNDPVPGVDGGGDVSDGDGDGDGGAALTEEHDKVRFKAQDIMRADLEDTLGMSSAEICRELGSHDCISEVHVIALGGTSPYVQGIFTPISKSGLTTPIAWERVVLSGCSERGRRDMANPASAHLIKGVKLSGGKLANVNGTDVTAAIQGLYQRALKRDATEGDIKALRGLYTQLIAQDPVAGAERWAQLACYAVVSSVEYVFY